MVSLFKFAISQEMVVGWTRTVVAFAYAQILSWGMGEWPDFIGWSWLPADISQNSTFVLIAGAVIYGAIRVVAEKIPQVGSLLIFNKKPAYAGVEPAKAA